MIDHPPLPPDGHCGLNGGCGVTAPPMAKTVEKRQGLLLRRPVRLTSTSAYKVNMAK